jgi:cholesterol transport system auxiliary component
MKTPLSLQLKILPALVLLLASLAGCATPKPIKYYQVTYPTKSFVAADAINAALTVRAFEGAPLYLDDKMVYGFDSPEMGTYEYERWVEPPVAILQDALVRGLRSSGRFKAVYTMRADPDARYILSGRLYDFKEVDAATVVARLSYEIHMRDRKTATTVWDHSYSYDEPATEKSVSAYVVAMDKNLQRSVQEVQSSLEEYFRSHPIQ